MGRNIFIVIPTWRCGNGCFYCDYEIDLEFCSGEYVGPYNLFCFGKKFNIPYELPPSIWIDFLHHHQPYHLELTGGEPTKYFFLEAVLGNVGGDNTWAITTNLTNIGPFVDGSNCVGFTASFHPFSFYSKESFLRNLLEMRKRGFSRMAVTIVGHPLILNSLDELVPFFEEKGFAVSVHPFLSQGFKWKEHPEDLKKLMKWERCMPHNSLVDFEGTLVEGKCEAGSDYAVIFPHGATYRCYSAFVNGEEPFDYIDSPDFKMGLPKTCGMRCRFPCDHKERKEQWR